MLVYIIYTHTLLKFQNTHTHTHIDNMTYHSKSPLFPPLSHPHTPTHLHHPQQWPRDIHKCVYVFFHPSGSPFPSLGGFDPREEVEEDVGAVGVGHEDDLGVCVCVCVCVYV